MNRLSYPRAAGPSVETRGGLFLVFAYLGLTVLAVLQWGQVAEGIAAAAADLARTPAAALDGAGLE